MMKFISAAKLWRDERGGVEYLSLMLITAIVSIAGVIGLSQIRDQVTQQFGDMAVALDNVDQSFSYTITIGATVLSASYSDPAPTLTDPANAAPACLILNVVSPTAEGGALPAPTGAFP